MPGHGPKSFQLLCPTAEAKANLFIWQNVIEAHVSNPHYETDEQKGMVIDEMIRMLQA